jgi:nucleoid-associated protein YgaU
MPSLTPFQRYATLVPPPDAGTLRHVFVEGETLHLLSFRYYGDVIFWKKIADYNDVTDPRTIPAGTLLLIPPRPLQTGKFESV